MIQTDPERHKEIDQLQAASHEEYLLRVRAAIDPETCATCFAGVSKHLRGKGKCSCPRHRCPLSCWLPIGLKVTGAQNFALRGKSPPLLLLLMLIMKVTAPVAVVPFVRLPCVRRLLLGDSCGSPFLSWSRLVLLFSLSWWPSPSPLSHRANATFPVHRLVENPDECMYSCVHRQRGPV